MTYLESDDYIELNRIAVKNENEDYLGVQYPEGLDVLKQVAANYYDVELYPTVWEKAAFILQKITKKHIFFDGNKRTALLATITFLKLNGYNWLNEPEIKNDLIMHATLHDDSREEMNYIASVLEIHSIKWHF